ncbi:MAG: hypothetical protein R3E39_26020 [Anaerolineae bacterium]
MKYTTCSYRPLVYDGDSIVYHTALTLTLLQRARTSLIATIAKLTDARNDPSILRYFTLLGALVEYVRYRMYLQSAKDLSLSLLVDPEDSDLSDWEAALDALSITRTNSGLTPADGWQKDSGIRIKEAYKSVWKIINKIANVFADEDNVTVNDEHKLNAMAQFVASFGNTELRIVAGHSPDIAQIYAIANSTGKIISLYNQPDPLLQDDISAGRNYALHTAENLVHEFGHVLDFRTGNRMYDEEWSFMRKEFGRLIICGTKPNGDPDQRSSLLRGFNVNDGWNIQFRQNKLNLEDFMACYHPSNDTELCDDPTQTKKDELCFELEIERIADMFLFWNYSDDVDYDFTSDDRGQTLYAFANGLEWSRGNTTLTPTGFMGWIIEVGETT